METFFPANLFNKQWKLNLIQQKQTHIHNKIYTTKQGVRTGPPCSVGRPTAHVPDPPAALQTTDADRHQRACLLYTMCRWASNKQYKTKNFLGEKSRDSNIKSGAGSHFSPSLWLKKDGVRRQLFFISNKSITFCTDGMNAKMTKSLKAEITRETTTSTSI